MKAAVLVLLVPLFASCAGGGDPGLTIGVASSLVDAIQQVETEYAGIDFDYSVAGSQVLAAQIREGAPIDVIITADRATARRLEALGLLAGSPQRFAGNRLAIAVAPENPLGISDLTDLTDPELTVILAAPEVPAGAYTRRMLSEAGITVNADSLEPSVRAVLAKVELGEADAGIVYVTDLAAAEVEGVQIDATRNIETAYFAAAVAASDQPHQADEFVRFLSDGGASAALASFGFLP